MKLRGRNFFGNCHYSLVVDTCWKCRGSGSYLHFGVCFTCEGSKRVGSYVPTDAWALVLADRREAKRTREASKNAARIALRIQENPWIVGLAFLGIATNSRFVQSLVYTAIDRELSEKQCKALLVCGLRWLDSVKNPRKATPVVCGRGIVVSGSVLSCREQESQYGWSWKMLILDDRGFKVWGKVPGCVSVDGLIGSRILFTANLEQSSDDKSFGFFKRPRKVSGACVEK